MIAEMASPLFSLPDEVLLSLVAQDYPCRDHQINALARLLHPLAAPSRNLVIYGTEATGKSRVTEALLDRLSKADGSHLRYAIVNSVECISGRHLFERAVARVADALAWPAPARRCETVSQLTVELSKMLAAADNSSPTRRFVLVFDAVDRQREAPSTLVPALARLSEVIPGLSVVFIVTSPPASFLRTSFVPHIHFPNYVKSESVRILSSDPPPTLPTATASETSELWSRFCGAVYDALIKGAARTLPTFRQACRALWPRFTAPILAGTHAPREFSKLLVAARVYFQDESLLDPGIIAVAPRQTTGGGSSSNTNIARTPNAHDLASLLPITARLLLLSAYLASHNATKHDLTIFSTYYHGRRRRRGGLLGRSGPRSKHRKIARKLLGAHAFVLERMMAIFAAVSREWAAGSGVAPRGGVDGDVAMAIATLAGLRLLVRVGGGGDPLDRGGKWRVNVGWELVRSVGRSMGIEIEEWLIE